MDKRCLGVELGSTRIKAVAIDEDRRPVAFGSHTWASSFENGLWTYGLDEVWEGLRAALSELDGRGLISAAGISGMMHGYLAFDADWRLLTPFRTWQNTVTGRAAAALSELFRFNIPQRWSIAHLYQAYLNGEEHLSRIAHITTLAGYVHYMLTGVNAVGVGEASGMMPVDKNGDFDAGMIALFDGLTREGGLPPLRSLLPKVLSAGENAGYLTPSGSELLGGLLAPGIPFAPPEGDAGTGMAATNCVAPRTGNVSAGTSIFSMTVLDRPMKGYYPEIDIVATPTGRPVAMVHCGNCSGDINAWADVFREAAELFGGDTERLYELLFRKSLEGDPDCGGVVVYNYLAGESITGLDEGRPMVLRRPDSSFSLANFMRAQLYSSMATLRIGMDILTREGVEIDSLTAHGGLFKTPGVAQRFLAAACRVPVLCLDTAAEGGPFGMALMADHMLRSGRSQSLEDYLARHFEGTSAGVIRPDADDAAGFDAFLARYKNALAAERAAAENL